jgi:methylenetetrahydrofolate reductase (NADPH)
MPPIHEMLRSGSTFSFEFFPPRTDQEQGQLEATITDLEPLRPSFVSVTYRGGRSSRERTTRVVLNLLRATDITPMPHLTCVAHPRAELVEILNSFRAAGLENLLALGGDPLPEEAMYRELDYAIELALLGREAGFESIGVAAHPAGHPRSKDLESDRRRLAAKLEVADFAITQFFFHADEYFRLVDDLGRLGVSKPVLPGIMPITNLASVRRMAELSGYAVPVDIVAKITGAGTEPADVRRAGIEVACRLCSELLDAGAPGLHFYTLNRSTATREIYRSLGLAPPAASAPDAAGS